MQINIHLKPGATVHLDTHDLWAKSKKVDAKTQVIKLKGTDDNGGDFTICLFGTHDKQSIVDIKNLDNTEFRINGEEINNEMLNPVSEEDSK